MKGYRLNSVCPVTLRTDDLITHRPCLLTPHINMSLEWSVYKYTAPSTCVNAHKTHQRCCKTRSPGPRLEVFWAALGRILLALCVWMWSDSHLRTTSSDDIPCANRLQHIHAAWFLFGSLYCKLHLGVLTCWELSVCFNWSHHWARSHNIPTLLYKNIQFEEFLSE